MFFYRLTVPDVSKAHHQQGTIPQQQILNMYYVLTSTMTQRLYPYLSESSQKVEGKMRKCISHIFYCHKNYSSICNSGLQLPHCQHSCLKCCNCNPGDASRSRCTRRYPWQSHLEPIPNAIDHRCLHRSVLAGDKEPEHRYLTNHHHRRVRRSRWS